MDPKENQMEPKGDPVDTKGNQMDPKEAKWNQKFRQGDKIYIHKLPINRPSGQLVYI